MKLSIERLQELVEQKIAEANDASIDDARAKSIVRSLVLAEVEDETTANTLIENLVNRKRETVLSYTQGLHKCVNCGKDCKAVFLHNRRPALFCASCRATMPQPVRN